MANDLLTDPFQPQAAPTPQDTSSQWMTALSDPKMQSALLQFGISLLQPPSFGDTTGSQIGRAIGSAGEALTAQENQDIKRQEADSKQALREARAYAAEARAGAAGARSSAAAERLGLAHERLGLSQTVANQNKRLALARLYNTARNNAQKAHQKLYEDKAFLDPKFQIPQFTFPDPVTWAQQEGLGDLVGAGPSQDIPMPAPAAPQPQLGGSSAPRISTQEEYQALPIGAPYYAPDGTLRTKR